jgi:hypothetical protein
VKQQEFTVATSTLVGANIIAASYEWLKALPEFAGAIDVFVTPEPSIPPVPPIVIDIPSTGIEPVVTQPADGSVN